jgi:hypothetical protein
MNRSAQGSRCQRPANSPPTRKIEFITALPTHRPHADERSAWETGWGMMRGAALTPKHTHNGDGREPLVDHKDDGEDDATARAR